ncbi:hypothetical protein [Marinobacterium sp. BA1]|uniref:hypothetical protein n=1 Tax=Marinobacterium sp. BA1 TaxID=3138931 RepID=UPI0032E5BDA4
MMPASSSAKSRILALASRSGITFQPTYEDALAEVITRLSDDDVVTDDIEDLTVALKRSGVITGNEMVDLLGQYLTEKYHV